ncbi:MAG: GGDEF domain-containing protein [Ilumatobacteraceae bacterium]
MSERPQAVRPGGDRDDRAGAAAEARAAGQFDQAAELFLEASEGEDDLQMSLHLQLRAAHCLAAVDRNDDAVQIATTVAEAARTDLIRPELVDALGILADDHLANGRLAAAAGALAEATYTLEQVPDDPAMFQVVHNIAESYAGSGFTAAALGLFARALELSGNESDRQFCYASIAAVHHRAALRADDESVRRTHLYEGLHAATAALELAGEPEVLATCTALAHRSQILSAIGQHRDALDDARSARRIASEFGMRDEEVVAMVGEITARWHLDHDVGVLDLIAETYALAGAQHDRLASAVILQPIHDVEVEALWSMRRYDEARAALQGHVGAGAADLRRETAARLEHLLLGVEHLRVAALSRADPLTGLPNRRFLDDTLPEVLEHHPPVALGVIDLDGFKKVNDVHSYAHGDRLLQEMAVLLERVCRRCDTVIRLGGDEFVMVLRETSPNDARTVFERVRQVLANRRWDGLPDDLRITASVGVAVAGGLHDPAALIARANTALRMAKGAGRDRIEFVF